jgi:AmiR/NasT family two-component response regulator
LESRESEVISIMMSLFDQGEVLDIYIEDLKNDIEDRKAKDMAKKLLQKNQMSKEDIAEVTGLSMKKINKLEKEIMQLA